MLPLRKQTLKKALRFIPGLLLLSVVVAFAAMIIPSPTNAATYPDKEFCERSGGTWGENRGGDSGNIISYTCTGAPSRLVEEFTPSEELTSFSLYTGIADCIGTRMYPDILASASDNGDVSPAKWFDYDGFFLGISIGDLYKEADVYPSGEKKCDAMVTQALEMWGYGDDYSRFLRDMGYTFNSTSLNWHGSSDGGTRYREFQDIVKRQVYPSFSGSVPALSKAAQYLENLHFFQMSFKDGGCSAQDLGTYPTLGGVAAYKRWVDQNYITQNQGAPEISQIDDNGVYIKYSKIQIIGGDRKTSQHGFAYLFGMNETNSIPIDFYAVGSSRVEKTVTCDQMAKNITNFSNDYLGWLALNPEAQVDGGGAACVRGALDSSCPQEDSTNCSIDGVGWIVCPVINFLAGVADGAFVILADTFLRTDPQVFNTDGPTFAAWSTMRTIANVAFVIVFLIIIFSQLTGAGITNYGVKKMLPRLVVAAILVNISYFVSQLAIDISNILGYSLKDVLDGLTNTVSPQSAQEAIDANPIATGDGFMGIAGGVLAIAAVGVGFYALLSTLIPVLLAAVVALVMILFILIARQAIIILLVVVSPLAFVAFLLPNTQNLFTQWRKIFTSMLLLFPIIALVFGLSTLASQILTDSFSGNIEGDTNNMFGQIIASAVLILPLFVVPILLKKSLDSIPMLGQLANKLSSRANGNIGKKLKESYGSSVMGQSRVARRAGLEEFRKQRTAKRIKDGGLAGAMAGGLAITKEQKAQRDAVRNTSRAILAGAESKELTHAREALNTELAAVKPEDRDKHLEALAVDQSRTEADRNAAMHQLAAMGRDGSMRRLMQPSSGANQESLRRAIDANVGSLSAKAPDLVKGRKAAFKSVKGEELANFSEDTATEYMAHLATLTDPAEIDTAVEGFNAAVKDISLTPELQGKFSALAGKKILAGYAGLPPAIASRLTAGFGPDGKIR